ncbi:MAG: tRNA pseudouridine(38-40) synthase TruA [Actinomycetota bacterium]
MTTRLRLDIAYDGSGFSGWSRQPALRTVQGVLEAALATVFARSGPPPTLTVAGRTDAGVHALAQVAHVDLTEEQLMSLARRGDAGGASALARRLNGIAGLDSDVWVTSVTHAPAGFDARFSAVWRRYEYRLADAAGPRNPLERARTLWYPAELDLRAMDAAASGLVGLHDWAAYCKPREGATTIRTLQDFRWARDAEGVLVATVQADAFCHSMVRALVGATVAVGEGKLAPSGLTLLRDELQRTSAFKVMPAKGLTLLRVGYPDDSELAVRAEQTRARRDAV